MSVIDWNGEARNILKAVRAVGYLEGMSSCNVIYFCPGWENARGCRIEHDAAAEYGLEVMYG